LILQRQLDSSRATAFYIAQFFAFGFGAINVLGFAPYGWFPLPIISLAALFWLWRRFPQRAVWLTFSYGIGYFVTGVGWLYVSLHDYGGMSWLTAGTAIFLFSAFLALFPIPVAYLYQRKVLGSYFGLAAAWMLQEWVRSWIFTGFPWLSLGYSQVLTSPLSGYAPVFGVFGISLFVVLTSAVMARPTLRATTGIVLLWSIGFGLQFISWTHPIRTPFSVSLLQGNIDQSNKWRAASLEDSMLTYAHMVMASKSQLIILPETALPIFYHTIPPEYLAALSNNVRAHGGDVLIGIPEQLPNGLYYNSLMSFGRSPHQTYRKYHLVPFGEYFPMKPLSDYLMAILKIPMSDFSQGPAYPGTLNVAGQKVAADICYEDVFGDEIIRPLPQASVLVNVTDDAWFGNTPAPWQHLQIAQMRALETGRYMLRATNTGVTAIINPQGKVVAHLPIFTRGVLNGSAQGYQGETPFVRFGNRLALLLAGVLLFVDKLLKKSSKRQQ
jgi:apolipoprotein N-acyltransferase